MKPSSINQLLPHEQRIERQGMKRNLLLSFLSQEVFTNTEVAGIIMGLQSRQAAHKTLTHFERDGLIRKETLTLPDYSQCLIWGITSHGQGWSYNPDAGELPSSRVFEPSRVACGVLRHTLDVQKIRIAAESAGWTDWRAGDKLARWEKNAKRPDALSRDTDGRLTAVEVERSFKSTKRYMIILSEYLQMIKQGTVDRVVWVSPNSAFTQRLKGIITSISEVPVAGQKIKIEPSRHHSNLYFCDYSQWPLI